MSYVNAMVAMNENSECLCGGVFLAGDSGLTAHHGALERMMEDEGIGGKELVVISRNMVGELKPALDKEAMVVLYHENARNGLTGGTGEMCLSVNSLQKLREVIQE